MEMETHMPARFQVHPDVSEIVMDTKTGLQWQRDYGNPSNHADAERYAESLRLGGFADWRLPTREELKSLVDYTRTVPAIDVDAFPSTPPEHPDVFDEDDNDHIRFYWTSTKTAFDPDLAWVVNFEFGNNDHRAVHFDSYTRAVRGSTSTQTHKQNRFEIQPHAQGDVVIDREAGLMWQRSADGVPYIYEDACVYAALVEAGGFDDWRLPSIEELHSLLDSTRFNPATDAHAFPHTKTDLSYWTQTYLGTYQDTLWVVNFKEGDDAHAEKVGKYFRVEYYVRAVRSL